MMICGQNIDRKVIVLGIVRALSSVARIFVSKFLSYLEIP